MLIPTILVTLLSALVFADSPYSDPHFLEGRSTVVHLMEWKYSDIAKECETFLGPYGYGGVQLSPVMECAVLGNRPWYERYQPVSYKLVSRSGNEDDFKDMVNRCNKAKVRVYVDVVLNHMTGIQSGKGTAGDSYDANSFSYPAVPYTSADFHGHESCPTSDLNIPGNGYDDPNLARNCQLGGLRDLNQAKDNVRQKQTEFLNHLISLGVAGFRSDASKHQWPQDMRAIITKLNNLNTAYFSANSRPFFYHEVIQNPPYRISANEYLDIGRVIEFRYFRELSQVVRKQNNQLLKYLKNFGPGSGAAGWGFLGGNDALVMIDSHDLQRGHTGDLSINIAYFEPKLLKIATAFMLAWPYAIPRVMSSYYWPRNVQGNKDSNDWMGPPNTNGVIHDVVRNPDLTCNNKEWICEHRWREIYNMVKFRNVAGAEKMDHWWDNGHNAIAFSRGSKAFIAINNDDNAIDATLNTGLPAGQYCDVISGNVSGGKCTGKQVTVNSDGTAHIQVDNKADDPILAIHVEAKI